MRLLLIASTPMEFRGLRGAGWHPARRLGIGAGAVDWARTIRLASHELLLVANGAGARLAASAVDAACQVFQPDAVISTGFCGALDPQLRVADVVVGTSVVAADRRYEALPVSSEAPHHSGVVCSIDHVAQTAEEKRRLRAGGGMVVEMEAAGVAARAEARGLPFYCVRVVTDLAGETMANDFNAALRADGHFDTMIVLTETLRRPFARLPELYRLRQRSVRAARVVGDFFADCRF
jgi:adenosylhomocysteine nucleosidase